MLFNFLGILKENGSFRIPLDGETDELSFEEIELKPKDNEPASRVILLNPPLPPEQEKQRNPLQIKIPVLLDDGSIAEIILPNGLKKIDLERIVKVLNAYVQ